MTLDDIERRSKIRFPLELPVRYRTLTRGRALAGEGRVVNVSSAGVLVACRHQMEAGARMELDVEWPSLLDGRVPLQLVLVGQVVRCEASTLAVVLDRHQFRTFAHA